MHDLTWDFSFGTGLPHVTCGTLRRYNPWKQSNLLSRANWAVYLTPASAGTFCCCGREQLIKQIKKKKHKLSSSMGTLRRLTALFRLPSLATLLFTSWDSLCWDYISHFPPPLWLPINGTWPVWHMVARGLPGMSPWASSPREKAANQAHQSTFLLCLKYELSPFDDYQGTVFSIMRHISTSKIPTQSQYTQHSASGTSSSVRPSGLKSQMTQ